MSPRLIGAVLASVAAILLVVSMATSALWAGHPSVNGREIEKKTVYIGLIGGQGCNTGGDGTCEDLTLSTAFATVSFIQLGTSSLFVLVSLLLAITGFVGARSRKSLGKVAIAVALLCVAVVLAQILIGPNIQTNHDVAIPIGYGMYLFLAAIVAVVLGGVLTPKEDPPLTLRAPRQPALPAPAMALVHPQQPQIDVLALLQDESRPAPPSPGGMLPGPAGPLGAGTGPAAPMFGPTPQHRPLFEQQPPFVAPGSPFATPPRPNTASPPPMLGANRADTAQDPVMPAPPPVAPPPPNARTKAASVAPPPRVKAPSIPPPPGGKKLPAPGFTLRGPTAVGMAVQVPLGTDPGQRTVPAGPSAIAQSAALPAGSPMQAFTGASEPSEEIATRAVHKEPDVMVGSPISVGDSTDTNRNLPEAERTDVNARPVTDDGEEAATVFRKKEATPPPMPAPPPVVARISQPRLPTDDGEEAATVARPKQDPEDLVTDPSAARVSAKSMPKIPLTTAPEALPPPKEEKTAHGGPQPACPQCEAPMNWVEEHLRFYCKSCRMYF
ncbi:MAG: hypothetical protein ACKV2T_01160 [Kofleriaceae bacterium]